MAQEILSGDQMQAFLRVRRQMNEFRGEPAYGEEDTGRISRHLVSGNCAIFAFKSL